MNKEVWNTDMVKEGKLIYSTEFSLNTTPVLSTTEKGFIITPQSKLISVKSKSKLYLNAATIGYVDGIITTIQFKHLIHNSVYFLRQ